LDRTSKSESGYNASMKVQKKNLAGEVVFQYEGRILHRGQNSIQLEALFNREDMQLINVVLKKGDRFVETFYTDRWYNIFAIHDRDDETLKGWYCNIGKPAVLEADTVSYVDLALDLWVNPEGAQWVLDEEEFNSLEIDREDRIQACRALSELQEAFKSKRPPA